MAGKIISVEGIDGCGKGTNTDKMVEYIKSQDKKAVKISFPRYTTNVGQVIAKYLQGAYGDIDQVPHELICIAYATDRASTMYYVKQLLAQDYYVIMDRYTYSNLFTAAKMPQEKWKPFIEWVEDMEFNNLGVLKPDYNFYLYVDPFVSVKRIAERGIREYQQGKVDIHENNSVLLINTAKCYLEFAKDKDNWFVIDQMVNGEQLSPNEVFEQIKRKLDYILVQG